MFPKRYFGNRAFAPRYFPKVGGAPPLSGPAIPLTLADRTLGLTVMARQLGLTLVDRPDPT